MAETGYDWQSLLYQLFRSWLEESGGTPRVEDLENVTERLGLKPGDVLLVTQVVESIRDKRNTYMLTALRSLVAAMAAEPRTPEPRRAAAPTAAPDAEPETT